MTKTKSNTMTNGDVSKVMSDQDLKLILQCRLCTKVPYPPIYQCGRGHIVCSRCRDKMGNCYKSVRISNCSLCEAPPIVSRNTFLEQVFEKSIFKCEYSVDGCGASVVGVDLKKHLVVCEYRPIECHMGRKDDCNKSTVDFGSYSLHLHLIHNFSRVEADAKGNFNLTHSLTLPYKRTGPQSWQNFYVIYDGKVFIPKMYTVGGINIVKFHVVVLGGPADAAKYTVKISVENKGLSCQFHLPVYSIRTSDKEVSKLHQGILNFATINAIGQSEKMFYGQKLEWTFKYHITKK